MTSKVAQLAQSDSLLLLPMSYRNRIINGNFDIWQRGVSQSTLGFGSADRWSLHYNHDTTAIVSRQSFVPGQTDVPGNPRYFLRATVSASEIPNETATITQSIEGAQTFAGGKARLSFWAKADSPKNVSVVFRQRYGMSGGDIPYFGTVKVSLTTEWQRFSEVINVPSLAGAQSGVFDGELVMVMYFSAGELFDELTDGLGHQSGVFDVARIQLSEGATDGPFEDRPFGAELMLCQRYCETTYNVGVLPGTLTLSGALTQRQCVGAGQMDSFYYKFSVPKANPIITATLYNPAAANNKVRNYSISADCSDPSFNIEGGLYGHHGMHIPFTTAPGSSAGNMNMVHVIVSGEI